LKRAPKIRPSQKLLGFIRQYRNLLYLLDRLMHYDKPEVEVPEDGEPEGNLALYLTPRARRAVVSAYSKATVLGGGFYLNLARILSENRPVLEMLKRLGVDEKEFNSKLDAYLIKDLVSYRDKERLHAEIESLLFAAFNIDKGGKSAIDYADLFAALGYIENEQTNLLFRVFELSGETLEYVSFFGRRSGLRLFKKRSKNLSYKDIVMSGVLELERKFKVYITYGAIYSAINIASQSSSGENVFIVTIALLRGASQYVSALGDNIVNSDDVHASVDRLRATNQETL